MVNIVLDTNIYISAFLFSGDIRSIVDGMIKNKYSVFISDDILSEIKSVLQRKKFCLPQQHIDSIISEIEAVTYRVYPDVKICDICRDSDDHIILECAVKSEADYLITGDQDLLVLNTFRGIKILAPSEFLSIKPGIIAGGKQ